MKIIKIMLDKERQLKMCTRTFPTVEKVLGASMEKVDFEKQETIYALLLGLMIWQDKKLTLDKVYDIVDVAIENKMEKDELDFMEAFGAVLTEIGEAVNELMNADNPSK